MGKRQTVDFSGSIVAFNIKDDLCNLPNKLLKKSRS